MVCPASCSLAQYDRGQWRPGHLQVVPVEALTARVQTKGETDKQTVWAGNADWGTAMHAAKAGLLVPDLYRKLLAPHREFLWPGRLGLHEVGVSFNCETRTADLCVGSPEDVDRWKVGQPSACVIGTVDWWAELPTGEPWIDDLKTSKWEPETVTEQTKFYLLVRAKGSQFSKWDTGRISVTHIPREEEPELTETLEPVRSWKQLNRFVLDEFEEDLVKAYRRAIADPEPVPGTQCEYCPSALVCPKGRD